MIEIGFGKLVLLALVALIVLGPEKLPGAARTAGALMRRVRNGWDGVRAEVDRELQIEDIKRAAREAANRYETAQTSVKSMVDDVRAPFAQAATEVASGATVKTVDSLRSEDAVLIDSLNKPPVSPFTMDQVRGNVVESVHLEPDRLTLNLMAAKEYTHGGI
jgi:sec-independent protein translocase protein TatB